MVKGNSERTPDSFAIIDKEDSITFSTPTIEGTVMRRNKVDGNGTHPWIAEVTEGDVGVAESTISDWYAQVYEPKYTGQGGDEEPTPQV